MRARWKTILIASAVGYMIPIFLLFMLPCFQTLGVELTAEQLKDWSMYLANTTTQVMSAILGFSLGMISAWNARRLEVMER